MAMYEKGWMGQLRLEKPIILQMGVSGNYVYMAPTEDHERQAPDSHKFRVQKQ